MKKIFKKSLAIMVSAAICLTALIGCLSVSAATRGEGTFTVGSVSGKPGENVTVDVTLEYTKAPDGTAPEDGSKYGIAATLFDVQFAKEKLEIVSIKSGETIEGDLGQRTYRVDYRTSDGDNVYIDENNCVRILAQAAGVNEEDGTVVPKIIATLEFKIKEGTAAGDIPVTIYKQEVCDYGAWQANESGDFEYSPDAEFIDMSITNGKVTVTEDHVHVYGDYLSDEEYHWKACSCGVTTAKETHVFDTGVITEEPTVGSSGIRTYTCEVCGYEKETTLTSTLVSMTSTHNLNLQNNIEIGFVVPKSYFTGYEDSVYAIFTKEAYNASGEKIDEITVKVEGVTYVRDDEKYEFVYKDAAAKEMGSIVHAVYYGVDASGNIIYSNEETYSIKEYALDALELYSSYTEYEKLCTVIVDMLNYGTAAQKYFNYNTANLVNADFEDYQKYASTTEPDLINKAESIVNDNSTIKLERSLNLESSICISASFAYSEDISNLKVKFEYNDQGGSPKEKWVTSDQFDQQFGKYYADFAEFTTLQMNDVVRMTLYNNDTIISDTVVYSIGSYAYAANNLGSEYQTLKDLTKLMMVYGQSAIDYFA